MRLIAVTVLTLFCAPLVAQTSSFQWHAFLSAREIRVESQPSWATGGIGRFDVGATAPGQTKQQNLEVAQIGFDWTAASWLLLHADGLARREPSGTIGKRAGLVQAYADLFTERLRLRAGTFWLPTSRENVDPLWTSRYTITYSALNSWIAQEVRPVGADLQFSPTFYITAGATAFRGNDTMGTELAARGWTFGNRITVYDEKIALPPDSGGLTRPIGSDLDKKFGFSERVRLQLPERAMLQVTHIDNRAELRPAEAPDVPWQTRFNIVGAEAGSTQPTTIAGEWAKGRTTLAFPGGTFALDFDTAYILVSQKTGKERYTTRVERFTTRSHAHFPDDASREKGKALTIAWLHDMNTYTRLGLEYAKVDGDRPGAPTLGFDPRTSGNTITLEVRLGY